MNTTNTLLNQYYEQSFCADEISGTISMSHTDKYYKDNFGDWSHMDIDSSSGGESGGGGICCGCGACAAILTGLGLCLRSGCLGKIFIGAAVGVSDCCCG